MEILELIENHYLKLGMQIAPTLTALVPSVLLMIEENDETIKLKTIAVIDGITGVASDKQDCRQQVREWVHLYRTSAKTFLQNGFAEVH